MSKAIPIDLSPQMQCGTEAMGDAIKHIERDYIERGATEGAWKAVFTVILSRKEDTKSGEFTEEFSWTVGEKKPDIQSPKVLLGNNGEQLLLPLFDGADDVEFHVVGRDAEPSKANG